MTTRAKTEISLNDIVKNVFDCLLSGVILLVTFWQLRILNSSAKENLVYGCYPPGQCPCYHICHQNTYKC